MFGKAIGICFSSFSEKARTLFLNVKKKGLRFFCSFKKDFYISYIKPLAVTGNNIFGYFFLTYWINKGKYIEISY